MLTQQLKILNIIKKKYLNIQKKQLSLQETSYLITLKTIKYMIFSTKAASFLSSIKTQTYDKKEREMIITYQQKRVFHLSLLMLRSEERRCRERV